MKKTGCVFWIVPILLCACSAAALPREEQYTATYLTLFDTVTTVVGYAESEAAFYETVQPLYEALSHYHRLFDIYHTYDGMHNLKTVNDCAGRTPVAVEREILLLLEDCKRYASLTGGAFNPAMGSVLSLWHQAREAGIRDPAHAYLPDRAALESAAQHTDPADLILDHTAGTVWFRDPALRLDVGGIAKGWAVERVCREAPPGLLVSVGGNVYATGPKDRSGTPWAVGIRDPMGTEKPVHVLRMTGGSVVTSGSYFRTYTVEGMSYHHIIDPETLSPARKWISVTVVCADSGTADMLTTALFLLDREAGGALLAAFDAQAMWIDLQGERYYSADFQKLIRKEAT